MNRKGRPALISEEREEEYETVAEISRIAEVLAPDYDSDNVIEEYFHMQEQPSGEAVGRRVSLQLKKIRR